MNYLFIPGKKFIFATEMRRILAGDIVPCFIRIK